jgi:hypothetical protein
VASPETSARGLTAGLIGNTKAAVTLTAVISPRVPNTQQLCADFTQSNHYNYEE